LNGSAGGGAAGEVRPVLDDTALVQLHDAPGVGGGLGRAVANTTVRPAALSSLNSCMIWSPESASSAPVGSSSSRIGGSLTSALAISTLRRCASNSSTGMSRSWPASPTFSSARRARARRTPARL